MIDKESVIGQLMERVKEKKHELSNVEDLLRTAILAAAEFKVGDIVVVTEGTRKRTVGRVRTVHPKIAEGRVWYEVSPQTKTGFHASQTIDVFRYSFIDSGAKIERYDG